MIVTDRFAFIHMPKTGGTFVTAVLERLHQPDQHHRLGRVLRKARRLFANSAEQRSRYGALENLDPKHGTCHDIPPPHRSKPILSCMRGPQEWYVSQYEFAWWKRTHLYDPRGPPTPAGYAIEQVLPEFAASRPHFPDISFAEFMELCEKAARVYDPAGKSGLYTHGFARYFFKKPREALSLLAPEYLRSGEARNDMFDIHFIHTERLNEELALFLRGQGYYTPTLERHVREKDWALYELFPQYRPSPAAAWSGSIGK